MFQNISDIPMLTGNICVFLFLSIHKLGLIRSTSCIGSGVCLIATVGVWVWCGNHTVSMEKLHVFVWSQWETFPFRENMHTHFKSLMDSKLMAKGRGFDWHHQDRRLPWSCLFSYLPQHQEHGSSRILWDFILLYWHFGKLESRLIL